jgi:hypothetical protein
MSVARLIDLTAPNSENNLFKLSTVVPEDKFCTIIFVIEFFIIPEFGSAPYFPGQTKASIWLHQLALIQ